MEVKQKKLEKSQIEIEFELSSDEFKVFIENALEHLKKHVKVDGFRQGQAPAKIVEDKIKPESLLMEAGDLAVKDTYLKYISENKLEPVGNPEVKIIKIAKGSEFVFSAVITVLPYVELPDYKEIAKTVKGQDVSVTDEEVLDAVNYLQKSRAKFTAKNEPAELKDFVEITYQSEIATQGKEAKDQFILGEGGFVKGFEDGIVGMKNGEEKEISVDFPKDYHGKEVAGKNIAFKIKMVSVQKMELAEINDEFAKQMGEFESLTALKTSIKQGIILDKSEQEKQRKRAEVLEKIAQKAKFEMPEAMVSYEQERLMDDLKKRINQTAGISFENYLASVKKTEEEIKETYKKEAEKRLRGFLVLRQLGKLENIEITDKELDEEVEKALTNYKTEHTGHNHAEIDREQLKEYTKGVMHNEKIFQKLEEFFQNDK